jgi:hypothetical protein
MLVLFCLVCAVGCGADKTPGTLPTQMKSRIPTPENPGKKAPH